MNTISKLFYTILAFIILTQAYCEIESLRFLEERKSREKQNPSSKKVSTDKNLYDMYVLAIQWSYSQCLVKPEACKKIQDKNIFTLHGLWPSFASGERIADCNTGKKIEINPQGDMLKEMNRYWYSFRAENYGFWNHEYNKHGHCYSEKYSIKTPDTFFNKVLGIYKQHALDQMFIQAIGDVKIKEAKEIEFAYADLKKVLQNAREDLYFDITCLKKDKKQYIAEIRIYLDLEFQPLKRTEHGNCDWKKSIFVTFNQ
jgi:ribonuclease I